MANRYSKTGFTARQKKTLQSMRFDIFRILKDREGKQDSDKALEFLLQAEWRIRAAIQEAEAWKKS